MWKMFYEFAVNGQPKYEGIKVPKASIDNETFLEIKQDPELKTGFKPQEFDFWMENAYGKRWDLETEDLSNNKDKNESIESTEEEIEEPAPTYYCTIL